jgi:flagellar hook-associated protein 3 FlgL
MRISTNQIYQRGLDSLLAQQERSSNLENRLSTGVRVATPSDDPIASAQIELMNQRISTTLLLQKNRQNAVSALNVEESVLTASIGAIQRLHELQLQAGNAAGSPADRQALAAEIKEILNQLQDFANTTDSNGNYMFSGGQAATPAISVNSAGQYVYNGDSTQRFQAVAGSLQIAINDTGDNIFMRIPNGNGTFTVKSTSIPNTGTGSVTTGAVVNPSAYVPDNYTMSFATNSSGQLVVMVNGTASGNVIPPSGLVDDAPLYQEGSVINFNGMEMTVNGAPQAGDSFAIAPSQSESLFSTVQRMIANLSLPYDTATQKAATQTENNQLLAQLDSALSNISNFVSNLGSRQNQLDSADTINSNLLLASQEARKALREIEPNTVATEYNLQLLNLQVAQQSFVRIQGLSLFNYL